MLDGPPQLNETRTWTRCSGLKRTLGDLTAETRAAGIIMAHVWSGTYTEQVSNDYYRTHDQVRPSN